MKKLFNEGFSVFPAFARVTGFGELSAAYSTGIPTAHIAGDFIVFELLVVYW